MIPNLAVQEIHDTMRAGQARYAMPEQDRHNQNWQALWKLRGDKLIELSIMVGQREATIDRLESDIAEVTCQRDMLAKRCAEQARQIAAMHAPAQPERTILDAITAMQRQGVR